MQQLQMLREVTVGKGEDAVVTLAVCLLDTRSWIFLLPVTTGLRTQVEP